MGESPVSSKIKHRTRGSGGGRGTFWLLIMLAILGVGGVFAGAALREPTFNLLHAIIGLDESQLQHKSSPSKPSSEPIDFN